MQQLNVVYRRSNKSKNFSSGGSRRVDVLLRKKSRPRD
jgi:hypothetical protein